MTNKVTASIVVREHEQFGKVRVVLIDDEPWFFAFDVAKILGYEKSRNAVKRHCKKAKNTNDFRGAQNGASKIIDEFGNEFVPAKPQTLIPESDVYRLIMGSHLPSAEEFQDWVVEDVLPSIRKKGYYIQEGRHEEDNMSKLLALQESVAALVRHEEELQRQNEKIRKQKEKLDNVDGRVAVIEWNQEAADKEFHRIELSNKDPRGQNYRAKLNRAVRAFSAKHNMQFDTLWKELYREVYYRMGIDIVARKRNAEKKGQKISKLQIADDLGILEDMWNILSFILKQKEEALAFRNAPEGLKGEEEDDGEKWNKFPKAEKVKKGRRQYGRNGKA